MTLLNVFAENGNGNVDNHIGMQGDGDGEVTNGLEWTLWQANLGFVDIEALFGQCFCDIEIGDGTEQTAVHTGFLQDLDSQTSQFSPWVWAFASFSAAAFSSSAAFLLQIPQWRQR